MDYLFVFIGFFFFSIFNICWIVVWWFVYMLLFWIDDLDFMLLVNCRVCILGVVSGKVNDFKFLKIK